MTNKPIRWLGVREESRTISALLFSQKHNRNKDFRHTLPNIKHPELTDYNIDITGISVQEHNRRFAKFNEQQFPKSRKRLEHSREQLRHLYFDTENNTELNPKDYDETNQFHLKKSVEKSWKANKSSIEQVLYFSQTINDELIDADDWKQLMLNWSDHMKQKHGRDLINSTIHFEESSIHFHNTFSCLSVEDDGTISYKNPKINKQGYGSSLQDDFEQVFINTIDQTKLKNQYCRGIRKLPFNEVGDDYTKTREYQSQIDALDSIHSMSGELSIVETLENIRDIKKNFKGNQDALAILNKIQSGYKKLLKTEQDLNLEQKQFQKTVIGLDSDLKDIDNLIDFIDNNKDIKKLIIDFGGKRVLNDVGITTRNSRERTKQNIKKQ